jgi:TonB-dependent starch-binding outer membrane protein SusC
MKRFLTKLAFSLLLVVGGMSFLSAQRVVSGTITDASNGDPLIGANVLVKGTQVGTITDIDGSYSLKVSPSDVLVISYTGYDDQEVAVGSSNTVNVSMVGDKLLEEVLVVGYGTIKKRDLTGSVASLKEKDFNQGLVTSADQLLQSRVAGVNIVNNSGQPGGAATVKIRGNNSIRAGANPLYVVDGVPLDGRNAKAGLGLNGNIENSNPLNFLNPADISNIEVLKDASSAAIYGSRAANGVIMITTKKAKSGENKPQVSFGAALGTSAVLKKYDVLTGDEYRAALKTYNLKGDGGSSVDAFDAISRNGMNQNYNFSIGAGNDFATYRISAGYQDIQGIIKESELKRYSASINSNFKIWEDKAGVDFFTILGHTNEGIVPISTDAGFTGNLIGQALQWNPTIPLMTDGAFTTSKNNKSGAEVGNSTINPLNMLAAYDERANTTSILANLSPYFNITKNLQYRYRLGVNYGVGNTRGNLWGSVNVEGFEGLGGAAIATNTLITNLHSHTLSWESELTDNIRLNLLGGYEYQKFDFKGNFLSNRGFSNPSDFDNTYALQNGAAGNRRVGSFADPISELQSYFGRANFNVMDKYLLTATLRSDGSSKFGANNKYGLFPALGFAWNLKNESFLKDNSTFSDVKLRLGWGITGNQEFPAGAAQGRYALVGDKGVQLINAANPDLKWETSSTINLGLDLGIMDGKVNATIDVYKRKTNDLLLDPDLAQPGPPIRPWKNIDGEVQNSGIELGLNAYVLERENLTLNVGGNVSFLKNEFTNFSGADIETGNLFGQGSTGAFVQRMRSGYPLNTYFVRNWQGLDEKGNSKYEVDAAGNDVLVVGGDPNANVILGLSTQLNVKKLFFGMNWNGAFGHQLYNNTAMSVIPITNLGNRNVDANLLGGVKESTSNPIASSNRYIEDGDFFKLSNATLAYNFGKLGKFSNLSLSVTGQNLLVITDYTGFDPEINTVNLRSGIPSSGIEYIPYPTARTFVVGVNASF